MRPVIAVNSIKKRFDGHDVFSDLSFEVNEGDIVAIFGPNGCGKSTILNILSGLVQKDGGNFKIDKLGLHKFSYVFQNYRESLLPWRTNRDNVAFPLELQKLGKEEISERIHEIEETCGTTLDMDMFPYEMSGGQQQIIAFIRSLATHPQLLLMDEPFSALDYETNLILRQKLQTYHIKHKPTIVVITHDIEEAVHLANKIIVLSKRPAKIVSLIRNPAPYPRNIDFIASAAFHNVKDKVLVAFKKGAGL
jgi:NitT/TauT family transport system ATP-binding protein